MQVHGAGHGIPSDEKPGGVRLVDGCGWCSGLIGQVILNIKRNKMTI